MTFEEIMSQAGIPFLLFVVCLYYAWRLLALKDTDAVRGKGKLPLKDPDGYAKAAGGLLLFFAIASLVMGIIVLFNVTIALIWIVICTIILGIKWKKMHGLYE